MNTSAASQLAISDWVNHLASMPEAEFTQQNVHNFIVRHAVELNSLQPHLFFSPERYTRNLVFKNDLFECLVLCWDIGQSSPIHDHGGQLGWIYLVTGSLFVQNFRIEDRDRLRHTCRVVPANSAELGLHQDAFVDKDEDVHKVCESCPLQSARSQHSRLQQTGIFL